MSKLIIVFSIVAILCHVYANPVPVDTQSFAFAGGRLPGNLQFPYLPQFGNFQFLPIKFPEIKPLKPEDIKNMSGDNYQGASSSSVTYTKMVDGKPKTVTKHTVLINDNGKITEKVYED